MNDGRKQMFRAEYEEAVFRVLMDQVAELEGERLFRENERLKKDPDAAVPESVDRAVYRALDKAFAKRRRGEILRALSSVGTKVAVVFLIATALLTGSVMAFPQLRSGIQNMVFNASNEFTAMSFSEGALPTQTAPVAREEGTVLGYRIPDAPEGFALSEVIETEDYVNILYVGDGDATILVRIVNSLNANFDTEDASSMETVEIGGVQAMLVTEDDVTRLAFGDRDNNVIYLSGTNISREILLSLAEQITHDS